ncbi:MAG: hypothetical protein CR972_05105 [Candidatus Moraniibacteriota bacterium]|nr:MAG: hypothetical protein CR972_05105 [Candidatus Moranbacteria bacterium]
MSVAEIAKQEDFLRNLKMAQAAHRKKQSLEQKHLENIGQSIKKSRYNTPIQTDAQKRQMLKKEQKWRNGMIAAQKRNRKKKKNIKKQQKIIRRYNRVLWILVYTAAFADVLFDMLSIPIFSMILSFCTSFYINFSLWNVGPREERAKRRLNRAFFSVIDLVPIINLVPFSVLIVYKAQTNEKKRVIKAKKIIKKLQRT